MEVLNTIRRALGFSNKCNLVYTPEANEAISFAHEHINQEPLPRMDSGDFSPEYLLAASGCAFNEALRNGYDCPRLSEVISMVAMHSCNVDLVLYRGVTKEVYTDMVTNAAKESHIDYVEKGFMQCSLVKGHELSGEYNLRIFVPKDSKVVYLGNVNEEQDTYEVVIQHGAQLKYISKNKQYIDVELVSTN